VLGEMEIAKLKSSLAYSLCLLHSPINSPARAAVRVAVKLPDESFRRLETSSRALYYLFVLVLYAGTVPSKLPVA